MGAAALLAAAAVSSCSDDELASDPSTEPTRTETAQPAEQGSTADPGEPVPEGSGCEPGPGDLPDGRWFGTVASLTDDEVELDLACWFIGEDAALAAEQDGEESPPPNDYYVRDGAADTVVVPVAPAASALVHPDGSPQGVSGTVDDLVKAGEDRGGYSYSVWIEVSDGAVVSVDEQWVP